MSKIRLHGTSSGYTDIAPTAAAGNNTLTAPTGTGTLVAEDSSGNITISDGVVHTGDTDTIIKFPSADTISAETGGSERLRITSAGKILIGTTTPQGNANADDLVVSTAGHSGISIRSGTSHHGNIFFADATSGGGEYSGWVTYQHDNLKLTFGTDAGERLVIDSNGNTNITGITTCTEINPTQTQLANRNVIINGDMMISQRGSTWGGVGDDASTYTIDRWETYVQNSAARFTLSQDSESPDGFAKSLKIDCTTADTSLAATDEVQLWQKVEGYNCTRFNKGTSSAQKYTLSFWLKSSKTGTYICRLLGRDNTNRSVSASYTVSDTNWNRYVITFPADSTAKDNCDNGEALRVVWWLVAGSGVNSGTLQTTWVNSTDTGAATGQVNFADSTDNVLYLTGVQMEVGSVATPYEHQNFNENFSRCARYYQEQQGHSDMFMFAGKAQGTTTVDCSITLNVPMRAEPTLACSNHRAFKSLSASITDSTTAPTVTSWDANHSVHSATLGIRLSGHSGFSNNEVVNWCPKSALFTIDSEL